MCGRLVLPSLCPVRSCRFENDFPSRDFFGKTHLARGAFRSTGVFQSSACTATHAVPPPLALARAETPLHLSVFFSPAFFGIPLRNRLDIPSRFPIRKPQGETGRYGRREIGQQMSWRRFYDGALQYSCGEGKRGKIGCIPTYAFFRKQVFFFLPPLAARRCCA